MSNVNTNHAIGTHKRSSTATPAMFGKKCWMQIMAGMLIIWWIIGSLLIHYHTTTTSSGHHHVQQKHISNPASLMQHEKKGGGKHLVDRLLKIQKKQQHQHNHHHQMSSSPDDQQRVSGVPHNNRDKAAAALSKPVPAVICVIVDESIIRSRMTQKRMCYPKKCPNTNDQDLWNVFNQTYHNKHNNNSSTTAANNNNMMKVPPTIHYGYGFIHRPISIRQHHSSNQMIISGQATAGSGCAISHKYQFIFIHTLKSGGMSIKSFLKRGLCNGITQMPCSNGGKHMLDIVSCHEAIVSNPNYFIWSFVRNPYSRMYSIYAMAYEYRSSQSKGGRKRKDRGGTNTTRRIYRQPKKMVDKHAQRKQDLPPFSFETFVLGQQQQQYQQQRHRILLDVSDVIEKGQLGSIPNISHLHTPTNNHNYMKFRTSLTHMDVAHMYSQVSFLFTKQGCPIVDFIGHLEQYSQDLYTILTYIDSTELWQEYNKVFGNATIKDDNNRNEDSTTSFGARHKAMDLNGNLQKAYYSNSSTRSTNHLQEAVAIEFANDFEWLGYDPRVVPQ